MKQTNHSAGRAGFTLVELLVVIAIIAVLASLLLAGVMAVFSRGPEAITRNDILQIQGAMNNFKSKYGFYPPGNIRLCSNYAQYNPATSALDARSLQAISRVWPNLGTFTGIQWAGPNTPANFDATLEGDQAIVFWLGGPPLTATTLMGGFSTNPTDPISVGAKVDRIQFMTFDTGRLTTATRAGNNASAYFPSFLDGYGKGPYVYFSSGVRTNGYTTTANTLGVLPYMQTAAAGTTPATYWNSNTFQIIAPGQNGHFGPGGVVWPPSLVGPGADDMTNFTDVKLGNAP